jgi:precorrin-4 methylase
MTLENRLIQLAQAIGSDIKIGNELRGDLSVLTTVNKSNLVESINDIVTLLGTKANAINDASAIDSTDDVWSANKITAVIEIAKTEVRNSLVDGASAALDTLSELATALGDDPSFATTIATGLANRVRFDAAQTLTALQKTQALTNIGAVALTDVGNFDSDLVNTYTTSKA